MLTLRRLVTSALLLTACAMTAAPASAQTFPDRTIRLVVPYGPGGQFDYHARMLADRMTKMLGQSVVVENKPGAATMIGAEYVKNSPPDGYTLLWAGNNMLSVLPHIAKKIAYKVSDFQTVTLVSDLPMSLVIDSKQMPGVNSVKEFIEYVKARPGKVDYGASGLGGVQHMMSEIANSRWGLKLNPIPYRGTPDVLNGLLGGQVAVTFDGILAFVPVTQPGMQLKMLAVTSPKRLAIAPNVPTMAELGYPEMTVTTYGGVIVPAGVPRPIVDKLNEVITKANNDPDVVAGIVKSGVTPMSSTPEEFDTVIKNASETWGEVVRKLNFKLD